MRCTRLSRSRSAPALLLVLLAACGDGGGAEPLARHHQLRLEIIQGKGIRDTVRTTADPPDARTSLPTVVRVYADVDASVQAGAGATGPALEVRIPPVDVTWRTLESWCQPERPTSSITRGDTAVMYLRLPTVAENCHVVVEGALNGNVFDSDTAVVDFDPGPVAYFEVRPFISFFYEHGLGIGTVAGGGLDAYGNPQTTPQYSIQITAGAPVFTANDTLVQATGEGMGAMRVTWGTVSHTATLRALRELSGKWRLSWACYDASLPGGAHADSARYVLEVEETNYGGDTMLGSSVRFFGTLVTRLWMRGEPLAQSSVPRASRFAAQRPGELEWAFGQVSRAAGRGYAGGSLCEGGLQGAPWARWEP
ncbi:MAG TPA: hypothetical protein VK358_06130, partial [Longimicrobium sp.]|nr:hypothetical protein [Longimicrobium sp.]